MLQVLVAGVIASMAEAASGSGLGEPVQSAAQTPSAGPVNTIHDAVEALNRTTASGRTRSGRNMAAIPIGSPGDWFSPDDYPPEALRASRTGRTVVAVGVDSAGVVVTCRVLESSGTDVLDQRTCDLAKAHGRFNPATDGKARPIASEYTLPVRWAMPDGGGLNVVDFGRPTDVDKRIEIETTYDPEGSLLSCRVLFQTGNITGDPCKAAKIGSQTPARWQRGGVNVGARVVQTTTYHAEPLP